MTHVFVLPHLAPETVALAFHHAVPPVPELDLLLLPLGEAGATAAVLLPPEAVAGLDLEAVARALSAGGQELGLAVGEADEEGRRWTAWRGGQELRRLGPADETWLPVDEDGFPDLDARPMRAAEGPPAGWARFRSCHDLGMTASFSCRFSPVAHVLGEVLAGGPGEALRYRLFREGRALHPPPRVSVPGPARGRAG